ncbi:MAG TPA: YdeI/OmpD-associated family protein [Ignavibacteria bacterium]|jgi:uncharacterized protein YdeI (YjbR/CyaY-like superfamily)
MPKKDKRIDTYIEEAPDFAKPILYHLRELVHKGCTDVKETIKEKVPHFLYKDDILCSMASFKQGFVVFWFRKALIMKDRNQLFRTAVKRGVGNLGYIRSKKDLPPDNIMIAYIKEAARLNEKGIRLPPKTESTEKRELEIPDYIMKAIAKNKQAATMFKTINYTAKKLYIDWITSAKDEKTRSHRIATTIQWITGGIRYWKNPE